MRLAPFKTINFLKWTFSIYGMTLSEYNVLCLEFVLVSKWSKQHTFCIHFYTCLQIFTENGRRMEALNEQKMRAHEQTIAGLEAKVKTLELNSATSEETNAALTMLNRQHAAAAIRRY